MSKWSDFYRDRLNEKYRRHIAFKYNRFIREIGMAGGSRFAEYGCGIGSITRALIEIHGLAQYDHTCVDFDGDILELAKKNLIGRDVSFVQADICGLQRQRFDVIHSHGVLEHMSDSQIRQTIMNQLRSAKKLIHYVPSWKYGTPSFGDERLMAPHEWNRICEPDEIIEFNDGHDLILKWGK